MSVQRAMKLSQSRLSEFIYCALRGRPVSGSVANCTLQPTTAAIFSFKVEYVRLIAEGGEGRESNASQYCSKAVCRVTTEKVSGRRTKLKNLAEIDAESSDASISGVGSVAASASR